MKYNSLVESILRGKEEFYGSVHISRYRKHKFLKKFYIYRISVNGNIYESDPFITSLDSFVKELQKRNISFYLD